MPDDLRQQIEEADARDQAGEHVPPIVAGFVAPNGKRQRVLWYPERYWTGGGA